ncbi:hypothetical protein P5G51_013480 [Virgibacillus sp. 179-BFC.A HS]|uniref:Phospholipase C/D domain-containing protein n=1 Tax=Tigheibacillus jepli TaxID=3035914 RepID=A0ABU5CIT6_9BACI|nr:hypothetical protein [Virgibacillus sp. 179-BFC.A HS]MDY0406267.1 hypothetical protein [Virgibacillus sp. 179-BFC.A HS]
MPAIWTHMLFCEDIADTIRTTPSTIFAHDTYMKLGSQGTNPLYFRHFWRGKKQSIQRLNATLQLNGSDLLMDLIRKTQNKDDQTKAYAFGFITHYILLKHICPYIQYGAENVAYSVEKMELAIDTIMMEKYHNLKAWTSRVYKEIDVGFSMNKEISILLQQLFAQHYPPLASISPGQLQQSYRYMKLALRLLADPLGWKNKLFGFYITPFSQEALNETLDYLNLEHRAWIHPLTGKSSTDSLPDLFSKSRSAALEILSLVLHYWEHGNEDSLKIIWDRLENMRADQ